MEAALRKLLLRIAGLLCAVLMLLFGFLITRGGYNVISRWREIGAAYAAIAVLWAIAGPVMVAAAVGILASSGKHRLPLWAGGAAAVFSGASLIAGVLTYVIPCSGPS